jgi:hypothetical protein
MGHVFGRTKITKIFLRIKLIAENLTRNHVSTLDLLFFSFLQGSSKKVFELFETLNLLGENQDIQDGNKN